MSKAHIHEEFAGRRKKALSMAGKAGLHGLLVTHMPDIRYLCGFSGSSGMLVTLGNRAHFITDFRYREQSRMEVVGARVVIQDSGLADALRLLLEEERGQCPVVHEADKRRAKQVGKEKPTIGKGGEESFTRFPGVKLTAKDSTSLLLGFDPEHAMYSEVTSLRRALRGMARLVPLKRSLAALRACKSRRELSVIRKGIALAEQAFRESLRAIGASTSEMALAAELDTTCRRMGAESLSFETIVASGKRGALVHAKPSRARISGVAVIDWGVVHEGYCTDCTRTIAFGRVPREIRKAHALVLSAQEKAFEATRPGVRAREVDRAARELIEKAGYGEFFGHGLGHGVGLEVHERPHVGKTSDDLLEEGMVFTVEPGIYLPGVGGVRVEDMVLVTRDGIELLTTLPRTLDPAEYV